jgi:hypothetical protein
MKKKIKAKLAKIEKKLAKTKSKLASVISELEDSQKNAKRPNRSTKSRIAAPVWEPGVAEPNESDGVPVDTPIESKAAKSGGIV